LRIAASVIHEVIKSKLLRDIRLLVQWLGLCGQPVPPNQPFSSRDHVGAGDSARVEMIWRAHFAAV
jgi:hypothetical protein